MGLVERLHDYYKSTSIVIVARCGKYPGFLNPGRSLPISVFHYENPGQDFRERRTRTPGALKSPSGIYPPSSNPWVVSVGRETLVRRSKAGPTVDESYNISYRSVFSPFYLFIFCSSHSSRFLSARVSWECRRGDATIGSDSFEYVSLGNAKPCRTYV